MRTFCRSANLRILLSSLDGSPLADTVRSTFQEYFGSQFTGSLTSDIRLMGGGDNVDTRPEWKETTASNSALTQSIYSALSDRIQLMHPGQTVNHANLVQQAKHVWGGGVCFSPAHVSEGNSKVLFNWPAHEDWGPLPGNIQAIFVHKRIVGGHMHMEFFFAVKPFAPLEDEEVVKDPFHQYPALQCGLFRYGLIDPIVLCQRDIVCHAATCPYESSDLPGDIRIVVSLNRVSSLTCYHSLLALKR
jgi:hypothetical protein